MKYFLLFLLIFFLLINLAQAKKFEAQRKEYIIIPLKVEIQKPEMALKANLVNFFHLNRSICLQLAVGVLLVINLFLNKQRRV